MKNFKIILKYFLLGVFCSMCMVAGWYIGNKGKNTEYITDTIEVRDTITELKPQYIKLDHYDTVKLPVVDYRYDTVVKLDSVYIQVPISNFIYDTVIKDTDYTTSLKAQISGFLVNVDSIFINTKIMHQELKKEPKWYQRLCPAAGVGYGTSGFGFFVGIGYKLN